MEDSIIEFVEELCLRFRLLSDNTQFRLLGDNLVVELTISWNTFGLNVAIDAKPISYLVPEFDS